MKVKNLRSKNTKIKSQSDKKKKKRKNNTDNKRKKKRVLKTIGLMIDGDLRMLRGKLFYCLDAAMLNARSP